MKLVIVQEDYIQYLKQYSKDVKENKNSSRPYVGVILKVGNQHYFAPLASPKPKHKTMDDKLDFIKIKKGELGAINLNNMIPIPIFLTKEIDLLKYDKKYQTLLKDQINWINRNDKKLLKNSLKLYTLITKKKNTIFHKRCNNFKLLEEKSLDYQKKLQYNCLTGNIINIELHSSGENKWIAKKDIEKFEIEKKEDAKEVIADIYLKMSEKELREYIKNKENKNLSDEEKLYQVPITYYNVSDLKITKEIEQKFIPMKEKKKTQEIDKSKGQGIGD
ncbi:type III toxin-antitoxin system ToxN/AbiQ family toxin [Fusobacterium polymorphum]|uniref:type III toxin-antitoxin system ToxN/AbiQ family toxin n=1 Tax=Fusobacterium nucleatum subsp. polymorphum TaxID=76857 RepID=UPI000C1AFE51|nr:type III toxin-antitoxin system ToxN/AbiQ family toxin [Fusobacterium polymorphum]PIM75283.1 phage resistance protein [Fusobacterium polymorphum]